MLLPLGIGVIKILPPFSRERWQQFGTADIGECTELLNATNLFAILADTRTAANATEEGVRADSAFYLLTCNCASFPFGMFSFITYILPNADALFAVKNSFLLS